MGKAELVWKWLRNTRRLGRRDFTYLSTAVVIGIKLYMMLQNSFFLSSKSCSLDRAKEGISSSSKTKIWKWKEGGERACMKKFSVVSEEGYQFAVWFFFFFSPLPWIRTKCIYVWLPKPVLCLVWRAAVPVQHLELSGW